MEEKEARSPFCGNRFFPPHSGPRTFKEMLEGRPRRGRFDMHQKDEIMTAFRRISSGRGQAGDWEKAIKGYGIQATSDAFAENTWSNHGTAAGHWSRFVKARGLRTEILWVEQPTAEQRAELKMIFQEYMAWLCCAVAAREGEGMTPPSTIEAYARSIVTLHKLLDVDLSCVSSTISGFKKGRTKHLVDLRGPRMKAKKNGFSVDQLKNWHTLDWSRFLGTVNPQRRAIVLRALVQGSFGCQWRRSDATIKSGSWARYWNVSRASVRWFDRDLKEVAPSLDNLRRLHAERTGYASVRSPPGKNDQAGDGATARFPSLLPLASKGSFCPGMSLLELEIDNPCWDPAQPRLREELPLFVDPETGEAFRTGPFDEFVIWAFRESARIHEGRIWTEAEARKEYSLHSFRIGGCCALRTVGSPKHVRMFAGRWLSEAMGEYDREEILEMLRYMYLQQEAKGELLNGQPEDMPMYPEERSMASYGTYLKGVRSTRLTADSAPAAWRKQPEAMARRLLGQGPIKIMDDAISGVPQPGTGLPKRRPVFCQVTGIQEGQEKPVRVSFQDPRRGDRLYSFLEFAALQIRLPDPTTGSYVDV